MFDWFKKKPAADKGKPPAFPYPLEIVHGRDALAAFERIKRAGNGLPIIIGGEDAIERTQENMKYARSDGRNTATILSLAAKKPFPQAFLADREEELRRLLEDDPDQEFEEGFEIGEWPTDHYLDQRGNPGIAFDFTKQSYVEKIHIATIPTADATEIPAYLYWGGWNACPHPHHHVAAARYWRDKYGAELVTMAADVVEYRVKRRPQTREEALALAREHHDYCSEIDNLSDHAADLMASDWWFFWWD